MEIIPIVTPPVCAETAYTAAGAPAADPVAGPVVKGDRGNPPLYPGPGTMNNGGPLDSLPTAEAKRQIIATVEREGTGRGTVNFRLRDWLISRQRYWGPPIPMVYCDAC